MVWKISGAKYGSPVYCSSAPPVSVSPSWMPPWVGMPMMSPACFVQQFAPLRQEGNHVVGSDLLACTLNLHAHAAFEAPGANAHEHHAVAMRGIHVGLDLENDTGKILAMRIDLALHRHPRLRRRRDVHKRIQHFAHAEVVDCRAEEHRCLPACQELVAREGGRGRANQVDVMTRPLELRSEALAQRRIVQSAGRSVCPSRSSPARNADAVSTGRKRRNACP
jgi:hypothetical protein